MVVVVFAVSLSSYFVMCVCVCVLTCRKIVHSPIGRVGNRRRVLIWAQRSSVDTLRGGIALRRPIQRWRSAVFGALRNV